MHAHAQDSAGAGFLREALSDYPGTVHFASDKHTYFTFTKADDLDTQMIYMDWASEDEAEEMPVPGE